MRVWTYLAIFDTVAIVCGTYLICHDHGGFGFLCFLLAATTTVKEGGT